MPGAVEHEFENFLREKVREANVFKYVPTKFLGMLSSLGAYATVAQLLGSQRITSGYERLSENRRLDLTVEALVLEHKWRDYFDPVLLQRAIARLRAFGYQPKISARSMDILLSVAWPNSVEHIPLNLASLKDGDEIETVETWNDGSWRSSYAVKCTKVKRNAEDWSFSLHYDENYSINKVQFERDPNLEWGETTFTIKSDFSEATASFIENGCAEAVEGTATFLDSSLYRGLTRAQVAVLLRPGQAALRKKLLKDFGRCAVSNEVCEESLEVAHIIEHSAGGIADASNALLLRADLHSLYDAGLLAIDRKGAVSLAASLAPGSRYRIEFPQWNSVLPWEVLSIVQRALFERDPIASN